MDDDDVEGGIDNTASNWTNVSGGEDIVEVKETDDRGSSGVGLSIGNNITYKRLLTAVACLSVLLVFVVGGVVGGLVGHYAFLDGSDNNQIVGGDANAGGTTIEPTFSPPSMSFVDSKTVVAFLSNVSFDGGAAMTSNTTTPQSKALDWILGYDHIGPLQQEDDNLDPQEQFLLSSTKLIQRYVLATLWYSTNGPGWKVGGGTDPNEIWLQPDVDECQWQWEIYVPTWFRHLRRLDELGQACNGEGNLVSFSFQDNDLSGPLPEEIGLLTNLRYMLLSDNRLSGTLPSQLGLLTSLSTLWIQGNQHLTGAIPTELGQLHLLDRLDLSNNDLEGGIPMTLQSLSSCEQLGLSGNPNIRGQVPKELGYMKNLEQLAFSDTGLTGIVPQEVCDNVRSIVSRCDLSQLVCCCCSSCCGDGFGGCVSYGGGTLCDNRWDDACVVCGGYTSAPMPFYGEDGTSP